MQFLQIPTAEEMVNVTDSVKIAAKHLVEEAASDPGGFVEKVISEFISFGLKVLAALAIYVIGAWIIRKVKNNIRRMMERRNTEKTLATFISSLVSICLTLMLVLLTVGALGINTTSIAAVLGAGAMAIGMALSGTMENFAGGLIILIFKPFKAGDYICVNGFGGTVTDVSIVSTQILTPDNRTVIIPNGSISNGTVDNYSKTGLRRLEWKVGIEYGSDAAGCMALMEEIVKADSRALNKSTGAPEDPYAVLLELADSSVILSLRAWVGSPDYWGLNFDINRRLYEALPQHGYSFAFPHMDVKIK